MPVGKCLDAEDAPPERQGKTSGRQCMGVAITGKSREGRYRRTNRHHGESEDTWSQVMPNFPTRVRIPDKVTMGIRLVMKGVMLGRGLPLMVVVRTTVRLITVGVG